MVPNGYFTVDSVSTIVISQDTLEIIYGRYSVDSLYELPSSIIERIGDVFNLIPDLDCSTDNFWTTLRCYTDSVSFNYSTNIVPSCDYTTGLPEIFNSFVNIFPNPASDRLFIRSESEEKKEVRIMNTLGKEVLKFGNNPQQLDIHKLASGIYLIEIKNSKDLFVKKFIKE